MQKYSNIKSLTPESELFLSQFTDNKDFVEVHTSGSTGTPKLIRLAKSDMLRSAQASCRFFSITEASRLVCPLSAEYIAGKMMIVRAIVSGAELFMEKPSNQPITQHYGNIDLIPVVPSQLAGLLANPQNSPSQTNNSPSPTNTIKYVIVGGGPVPPAMLNAVKNAPFHTFATYGMTETASHVALRDLSSGNDFFTALPGINFSTDNDNCLKINAKNFTFDGIQTNDVVRLINATHFSWIGRRDNVIITGGVKVQIEQIERKISHLFKHDFYVIGIPDDFWGQKVVLYTTEPIAIDSLRPFLSKFELPKEIRILSSLSYTPTGKIRRLIK
ncbi:MAG: AMP-binding protein [Muribaculaceae bacterium]